MKRLEALLLCGMMLALCAVTLGRFFGAGAGGSLPERLQSAAGGTLAALPLRPVAERLQTKAALPEDSGVLRGQSLLMVDPPAPNDALVERNVEAVTELRLLGDAPIYLCLVPTATAIKQDELPGYLPHFNQRSYTDGLYRQFIGLATTVDAFIELTNAREQYIYCRTDPSLTGLGGYHVYRALCARMGLSARALSQFEFEHVAHDYVGSLGRARPGSGILPDILTLYRYTPTRYEYLITHQNGESRRYPSLYPRHRLKGAGADALLFGGRSARVDVLSNAPGARLLVLGDSLAQSVLPFLLPHYSALTLVDVSLAGRDTVGGLRFSDYDTVLLLLGIETFTQRDDLGRLLLAQPGA